MKKKAVVDNQTLQNIADAIRNKTGDRIKMSPSEMVDEIEAISGGEAGITMDHCYIGTEEPDSEKYKYWFDIDAPTNTPIKFIPRISITYNYDGLLVDGDTSMEEVGDYITEDIMFNTSEMNLQGETTRWLMTKDYYLSTYRSTGTIYAYKIYKKENEEGVQLRPRYYRDDSVTINPDTLFKDRSTGTSYKYVCYATDRTRSNNIIYWGYYSTTSNYYKFGTLDLDTMEVIDWGLVRSGNIGPIGGLYVVRKNLIYFSETNFSTLFRVIYDETGKTTTVWGSYNNYVGTNPIVLGDKYLCLSSRTGSTYPTVFNVDERYSYWTYGTTHATALSNYKTSNYKSTSSNYYIDDEHVAFLGLDKDNRLHFVVLKRGIIVDEGTGNIEFTFDKEMDVISMPDVEYIYGRYYDIQYYYSYNKERNELLFRFPGGSGYATTNTGGTINYYPQTEDKYYRLSSNKTLYLPGVKLIKGMDVDTSHTIYFPTEYLTGERYSKYKIYLLSDNTDYYMPVVSFYDNGNLYTQFAYNSNLYTLKISKDGEWVTTFTFDDPDGYPY